VSPLISIFYTLCEARGASLAIGPYGEEDLGHVWWNWDVDGLQSGDALLAGTTFAMGNPNGNFTRVLFEARFPFTIPQWPEVFTDKGWIPGTAPSGTGGQFCKMNFVQGDDDQVGVNDPAGEQTTGSSIRRASTYWSTTGHNGWDDPYYYPKFLFGPHGNVGNQKNPAEQWANSLSGRPNPFNPAVQLTYTLARAGEMSLGIYTVNGELVRRADQGQHRAGPYVYVWDGTDRSGRQMPTGVYVARFTAGEYTKTLRLMLMK
jgi:hypothetical protein